MRSDEGRSSGGFDDSRLGADSVYDAICRTARRLPSKTAIIELVDAEPGGRTRAMAYDAVRRAITARANVFRAASIAVGEPIVFLAPASLDAFLAFWAAHAAGAVAPVNAFLGAAAIAEIARACRARAIVSGPAGGGCGTFALARAVVALAPALTLHLVVSGAAEDGAIDLAAAAADADDDILRGGLPTLDDTGALFPTGGTTGAPKIVRLSDRNLLVGALATAHATSLDAEHVVPAGLPLFHVGGGVIGTTRALLLGHTLVQLTAAGYRSPTIVRNFWALAREHGFTQIITVPTAFGDLLRAYDGGPHGIRIATAGASKLPTILVNEYRDRLGIDLLEGYGMTECSGFCAVNPAGRPPRAGSGGIAAPFYQMRVVKLDDAHRYAGDCAAREWGHIVVAGPGVFQGYTDAGLTEAKLVAGMPDGGRWIDSGDLGEIDSDGYLWVVGRAKDLVIRGGHNIDPAPVEDALLAHAHVIDAAVVGMPDARVGELPVAFVQLAEDTALDEAALRDFCLDRVPDRAGAPVRILALPELPRTAMRKIFKPELRRRAAQLALEQIDGGTGLDVILETSGRIVVESDGALGATTAAAIDRLGLPSRVRETTT